MTESSHTDAVTDLLPRLRAIVARIAGPREVDDLVQECCVRILEKEHQFRGGASGFSAWASTVTRNLSRTLGVRNRRGLEEPMEHAERVMDKEPTLDEERVGWILDQLSRLPDESRELLRMRYYDGLSVEAVGERLGISQAGASKRLDRALTQLRDRAGRQGWLGALLPASWAAGLAGTSPMKLTLVSAAVVTAAFSGSFFLPDPETPIQGDTAVFDRTTFAPALATAIEPGQNLLWCGSLQLAWQALVEATAPDFDASRLDPLAAAIHADPFGPEYIDRNSFVAVGGLDSAQLIEDAQAQLIARFGQGRDPVLDSLRGMASPVAYAFLAKAMRFPIEFEDMGDRPFEFGPAKFQVQAWGIDRFDVSRRSHHDMTQQVQVLYYGGPDDFVLEFQPEGQDRIVLARLAPGKTLLETWQRVHAKRKQYSQLTEEQREQLGFSGGERLWIPKLDFDLSHTFPAMSLGLPSGVSANVLQTLRVRLDHRGAEIKSRATILSGSAWQDPMSLLFDGPFLAAFVQGDLKMPYAALWVADPELLVPWQAKPEAEPR